MNTPQKLPPSIPVDAESTDEDVIEEPILSEEDTESIREEIEEEQKSKDIDEEVMSEDYDKTEQEEKDEEEIEEANEDTEKEKETEAATEKETQNTEIEEDKCFYQYDKNEEDILFVNDDIDTDADQQAQRVPDEERISKNRLTKYERVRILGTRAKQISLGAKVLVKVSDVKSPFELALLELENDVLPYKIKRPLPNNRYEIWKLSELERD